ncbi:uncharacterized protein TNCV_1884891 [Trichonephila clavipes]|nr:uncharacterized protein TNCV_1884891 [Trichonephila clavipes]
MDLITFFFFCLTPELVPLSTLPHYVKLKTLSSTDLTCINPFYAAAPSPGLEPEIFQPRIRANMAISASSSRVRKRVSKGNFPRLEQCLVSWMRQCRGQNIPMGGSLLKEKAKAFAKELGIEFSASEG